MDNLRTTGRATSLEGPESRSDGPEEDTAVKRRLIAALRTAWAREIESRDAYRELAKVEADRDRRDILLRLADTEERHAHAIEERLVALGSSPPEMRSNW